MFRSTHLYAVGGSAGTGKQIARMELGGDEETWGGQQQEGSWQTGGGLETQEQRPNRPAVSIYSKYTLGSAYWFHKYGL